MNASSEEFVSASISRLGDKVQSSMEDAEETIESKAEDMRDTAEELQKQAQRQAYNAGVKLREWATDFWEQAEDTRHKIEDNIRSRPFISSLALFAAGVITARMITRR